MENKKPIQDSIERLCKVSVILQQSGKQFGFQLLSSYASEGSKGNFCVALNPLLTKALVGSQYIYLDMNEVRALHSDPARLMHKRLCGWINSGNSGKVSLETLCGYAWPESGKTDAMRKRRQIAKTALAEIKSLGWSVHEYSGNKFEITRPRSKNHLT
jgi:hypothetical protein